VNLVSENGCRPSPDPSVVNLSNSLTVLRIVAIPFILVLMQADTPQSGLWATGVFIAAFITDWLDGFIARKKNQVTRFGKMLDPLADKLLIGSALIMFISLDRVPVWMVILIISREIAVTWLRASLAGKGFILAADRWGKNKTFFQALALIPLILYYPYFGVDLHLVGMVFLWIALALTVWSGLLYFFRYYPMLMGGNGKSTLRFFL
jgi:CDP-diacylglycerol--glycerol-3-phosphate 3-phosphatidyltransferase